MLGTETAKGPSSNQLKQLDAALHLGVPTELRKVVWSLFVPNHLKINEKLYEHFIERAKMCQENIDKDTQFRKHVKVIEEDLHRTYSEMSVFRYGNRLY